MVPYMYTGVSAGMVADEMFEQCLLDNFTNLNEIRDV